MRTTILLGAIAIAVALSGCKKEGQEAAGTAKEKAAKPEPTAKGMQAKDNDPKVVAEVKKVLDCEWKRYGFSSKCEAYKAFRKSDLIRRGAADVTLVNLIEDEDEKVRWLAARMLRSHGRKYRDDPKLAARVLGAAEAERNEVVAGKLGDAVASIDFVATKLEDRVLELAKSHPVEKLRAEVVNSMLFRNRKSSKIFEVVKEMARNEENAAVRRAAVRAFWIGTPRDKRNEICELWVGIGQEDKDPKIAGVALRLAAQYTNSQCKDHYDTILGHAEKLAKAGEVKSSDIPSALRYIHKQKDATDKQKKQALAVAKTLLENDKNKDMARGGAMRFLGKEHPKGKDIAKKYLKDKAFFVKSAAKRALKG